METIHYKKHLIILDGQGYWNSNTLTNGDITATIYNESDTLIFKMKYLYFKKNEIVKMLKQKIKEGLTNENN
jgi:isochorismate hydrolase